MKSGCHECFDCGVEPFIISEDCLRCHNCENIPNSCRWDDDNNENEIEQLQVVKMK
jgi:hypothetical protein